jgi:hypothetical protein
MSELIAVQGMTLVTNPPTVTAVITPLPGVITKVKTEAKLVGIDGDQVTVSAITVPSAGATIPDPSPYTVALQSSASKVKAEGTHVLLEGDESETINATPQIPGTPPTNYPVSFTIKISVAGQTKAKGI